MQPQYKLDENNQPLKITTKSEPVNVEATINQIRMIDQTIANLTQERTDLINDLTQVQQIPNIDTKVISKIQEVPEFAAAVIDTPIDTKPINPAPLLPPNTLPINQL